jgi:anti-sigma B factor antagonist
MSVDEELSVTVRHERAVAIAEVAGDIDLTTVGSLRERLYALADEGESMIVDLNRVTFIDSAGLGVLIGAARRVEGHGGSLHAVCSQPQPRKLLWMTGVDRRIPLSATVDDALLLQGAPGDSAD